jgi:PAS domain S-box-containing protein
MTRLDQLLAYTEAHRLRVGLVAMAMTVTIGWGDFELPDISIGFLYLIPILLCAAALNKKQILVMAALCGYLREAFDPLQGGAAVPVVLDPRNWVPGSIGRMLVAIAAFAMSGFFVTELNGRRRLLARHILEREKEIRLRLDAEHQLRILIETSPLAILTLNHAGEVELANDSAAELLGFPRDSLHGLAVEKYLPILRRMLQSHRSDGSPIRTNVECKGQRLNGEVFLAHVWLATYPTSEGGGLAAVVWDASENLRDREGSGLDSMMATSRVLIGAISHEIRNLASAASSAHSFLGALPGANEDEHYQVLGTLIRGLEKIASSGLRVSTNQERMVADLGTVLDETRIVIESALRETGIDATWEVDPDLPLVQADHHSLLQVFVNLARNSQRALEESPRRELHVSARLESDLVVVRFEDTGYGVAHPEELFRPFQSGSQSSGLGLYISRAILRSHGGGLRYEPKDSGSCFAVELWPVENGEEG